MLRAWIQTRLRYMVFSDSSQKKDSVDVLCIALSTEAPGSETLYTD
jgi:hypothetical protein